MSKENHLGPFVSLPLFIHCGSYHNLENVCFTAYSCIVDRIFVAFYNPVSSIYTQLNEENHTKSSKEPYSNSRREGALSVSWWIFHFDVSKGLFFVIVLVIVEVCFNILMNLGITKYVYMQFWLLFFFNSWFNKL